jgi:hypothetical protein
MLKILYINGLVDFPPIAQEPLMAVASGPAISSTTGGSRSAAWDVSLPLILGVVLFIYLDNVSGLPLLSDPDTHWHIAVGNWMLEHRAVPHVDTFSFTFAGKPWIAKEWLSQILLATAFDLSGWGAVTGLSAAAVAGTFALLLRLLLRDLKPMPAILFTAAALVMMEPHFLARPHVLAFPVTLLWVAGLVRAVEERRAPRPVLLIAMLLWANMHGGFTLGLMLAGAFALDALIGARDGQERRSLFFGWLKFGVAALLAACITPYGPESILVTIRIFGLGDALNVIAEWRSPNFQDQPMQEIVLLAGLYLALSRGLKLPLIRLLIVIGLAHLYLSYARNAELLATFAPLAIAPTLARQWPSLKPDPAASADSALLRRFAALARPAGKGATAAALAMSLVFAAGIVRYGNVAPPDENTPAAALAFARDAGFRGHVFNAYQYGGPLINAGIPTFIDGRGELYGGDFIKQYVKTAFQQSDEPLEKFLDRFDIEWTILANYIPANRVLALMPGWYRLYKDDQATIFVRQPR